VTFGLFLLIGFAGAALRIRSRTALHAVDL
jgi:hypothetical protein